MSHTRLAPTLIAAAVAAACATDAPPGSPTRETLPNGAVLVRYPDLPAIDSVGPEVADVQRFGDRFEEYFPGGKGKMVRERTDQYKSLPLLERLPGYVRLLFADTGELWALRYRLPGAPVRRCDVFGVDGRHLGTVDVPASLRLHGISHGQLFGVTRDELDVQYVEVRDLEFS